MRGEKKTNYEKKALNLEGIQEIESFEKKKSAFSFPHGCLRDDRGRFIHRITVRKQNKSVEII